MDLGSHVWGTRDITRVAHVRLTKVSRNYFDAMRKYFAVQLCAVMSAERFRGATVRCRMNISHEHGYSVLASNTVVILSSENSSLYWR
jgi:hypothetical protein